MKESFWGYFIITLGISILLVLIFVQELTVTDEEDFYLTREVLEASMIDAIDYGSYRTTGRIVMSSEKFQEVFIRRFAESVSNNKEYTLDFYDIYEDPPKATVRVRTSSGKLVLSSEELSVNIDTLLSGILETKEGIGERNEEDAGKNNADKEYVDIIGNDFLDEPEKEIEEIIDGIPVK